MWEPMVPARRALAGAVLLDFAVGPLFLWDAFSRALSVELNVAGPQLSAAYAVGLGSFTAGVLVGGRVADAVAPRRIALVVGAGVVLGLVTAGLAESPAVLVLGFGVMLGGATGLGYATAVRVAGTAATKRGSAVAVVVSAYAAGAVVLAPVVGALLDAVGRTGMFTVLAVLLGGLTACASVLLPGAAQSSRSAPPRTRGAADAPDAPRTPALRRYRRSILASWVMFLLGSAPALVAFGHAGGFAGAPELAVAAVVLLNAGNFAGRLAAGPIADRIGHVPALHATAAVLVGACVTLALVEEPGGALAALLALGAQYGAVSVLTPMAVADTVPADRFGAAYGMVFSGWGVVGLAGPVGAAWLAAGTGYPAVAAVLAGVAALFWGAVAWVSATRRAPAR
ncbi:MFS transporter [Streptomonospora wellingtoniae]|uniref:MFS transporter n=1 Tax=Streptomonospora wellingtoniae TaxID=3075544 RepID=A0ABU2L1A5_9ACTN|nr:MFS transporter [Streptomonospora sp. DSM 45055]MDT0305186.1 MFS transporter [Streptomonospora sp. DSM 45055]